MIKSKIIKSINNKLSKFSYKPVLHRKCAVLVPFYGIDNNTDYEDEVNQQPQQDYHSFKVKIAVDARYALCAYNTVRYYKAKDCWNALRLAQYGLACNESIVSVICVDDNDF